MWIVINYALAVYVAMVAPAPPSTVAEAPPTTFVTLNAPAVATLSGVPRTSALAPPKVASAPVVAAPTPAHPWMQFRLRVPITCYSVKSTTSPPVGRQPAGFVAVASQFPDGWSAVDGCGWIPTSTLLASG